MTYQNYDEMDPDHALSYIDHLHDMLEEWLEFSFEQPTGDDGSNSTCDPSLGADCDCIGCRTVREIEGW